MRVQSMCSIIRLSAPLSFFTHRTVCVCVFSLELWLSDVCVGVSSALCHVWKRSLMTRYDAHVTAHATQRRRWDIHEICKRKQNELCAQALKVTNSDFIIIYGWCSRTFNVIIEMISNNNNNRNDYSILLCTLLSFQFLVWFSSCGH